jgi:hypothetical protein
VRPHRRHLSRAGPEQDEAAEREVERIEEALPVRGAEQLRP